MNQRIIPTGFIILSTGYRRGRGLTFEVVISLRGNETRPSAHQTDASKLKETKI